MIGARSPVTNISVSATEDQLLTCSSDVVLMWDVKVSAQAKALRFPFAFGNGSAFKPSDDIGRVKRHNTSVALTWERKRTLGAGAYGAVEASFVANGDAVRDIRLVQEAFDAPVGNQRPTLSVVHRLWGLSAARGLRRQPLAFRLGHHWGCAFVCHPPTEADFIGTTGANSVC
eukprot:1775635-Pyramimonas_sp.AAC.3